MMVRSNGSAVPEQIGLLSGRVEALQQDVSALRLQQGELLDKLTDLHAGQVAHIEHHAAAAHRANRERRGHDAWARWAIGLLASVVTTVALAAAHHFGLL